MPTLGYNLLRLLGFVALAALLLFFYPLSLLIMAPEQRDAEASPLYFWLLIFGVVLSAMVVWWQNAGP